MNPAVNVAHKQRGVSLSGAVMVMIGLALIGLVAAKMVPPYTDYFSIKKILTAMEVNGELKTLGSKDLRLSYARRALIDNVRSITPEDLLIEKGPDGNMVVSVEYSVKTPLVANISLLIDFNVSTAQAEK